LTLILIGQPELREKINQFKQFKQRLAIKYHINPLNEKDTEKYIVHRLEVAKARGDIFTPKAMRLTWEKSEGIPRVINNICDMSLLIGFTKKLNKIDRGLIAEVASDLDQ
jgi:type II secretory pathway predicted ATPase ExeA